MSDSESGFNWWIRYVIIPLIGSGGIAAVVVAIINRPPNQQPATQSSIAGPQERAQTSDRTATPEPNPDQQKSLVEPPKAPKIEARPSSLPAQPSKSFSIVTIADFKRPGTTACLSSCRAMSLDR